MNSCRQTNQLARTRRVARCPRCQGMHIRDESRSFWIDITPMLATRRCADCGIVFVTLFGLELFGWVPGGEIPRWRNAGGYASQ